MKKAAISIIVALLVLVTTALWFFTQSDDLSFAENLQFGIIILLILFGFWFAYRRLSSVRRHEPAEDEMSKKVMVKASSLSYFISLYMWVAMIYIKDRVQMETEVILGSGILAMAVIFAVTWIVIYLRGPRNE